MSIIGFDDIDSAAYQNPGLTTVRQPLKKMGMMAAEIVLKRINREKEHEHGTPAQVVIDPELIVRGTTCGVEISRKPHPAKEVSPLEVFP